MSTFKIGKNGAVHRNEYLMKRMLINATQEEEMRVALVDGQKIFDLDIEPSNSGQKKANIYKGVITKVEPSLEAAFVDYGVGKHGFLPLRQISREYFQPDFSFSNKASLKDAVKAGQEVIVQVEKEERGLKGAALTTYISLAGSFIVLMPNNPRAGGISHRIEGEERMELRQAMESLNIPRGMGVIVRTAGMGKSPEELNWDLEILVKQWNMIKDAAESRPAPFLIHRESNVVLRALRDYLSPDISEILIDNQNIFEEVKQHISYVRPDFTDKVHLYQGENPLFSHFQIESQIESAYHREVKLPSGGSIVIDPTEALTSIDVNSAKATKGNDIEETALQTNIEAAEEIARQLRLRDLGGLIVIDFIDMTPIKNQREIENKMKEATRVDRARIQFARISRFGLLEMSRQRLRPSLGESYSHVCPRCSGQGTIRDVGSLTLSILRIIEEEAMKSNSANVCARVPLEVAAFLMNEKRRALSSIENRHDVQVFIIPDEKLESPHYEVTRMREGEGNEVHTFDLLRKQANQTSPIASNFPAAKEDQSFNRTVTTKPSTEAVVSAVDISEISKTMPIPQPKKNETGIFSSIIKSIKGLFSSSDNEEKKKEEKKERTYQGRGRSHDKNRKNYQRKPKYNQNYDETQDNKSAKRSVKPQKETPENLQNTRPVIEENIEVKNQNKRRKPRPERKENQENVQNLEQNLPENISSFNGSNEAIDSNVVSKEETRVKKPRKPRKPKVYDEVAPESTKEENLVKETKKPKVTPKVQKPSKEEEAIKLPEYVTPAKIAVIENVTFTKVPMTEPKAVTLPEVEASLGRNNDELYNENAKYAGFSTIQNLAHSDMAEPESCELEVVEEVFGRPNDDDFLKEPNYAGFTAIKSYAHSDMAEPKSCFEFEGTKEPSKEEVSNIESVVENQAESTSSDNVDKVDTNALSTSSLEETQDNQDEAQNSQPQEEVKEEAKEEVTNTSHVKAPEKPDYMVDIENAQRENSNVIPQGIIKKNLEDNFDINDNQDFTTSRFGANNLNTIVSERTLDSLLKEERKEQASDAKEEAKENTNLASAKASEDVKDKE